VTIFEAMPVPGGMLRLGVPEYRLPTEIIEREVQDIIDLGVDLRLNQPVDNLDDLFEQGFEAVLIAVGAHEGIRLPIPGATWMVCWSTPTSCAMSAWVNITCG
jgi:formate dehydrogenase (NADP+) beta subunit